MKASEHLAAARDEIEKGWTQGTLQNFSGSVCAVGAISRVATQTEAKTLDDFVGNCTAGNHAATALEQMAKELGGTSIMSFNDRRDISKQDVLNWFDKTIAGLEERGE